MAQERLQVGEVAPDFKLRGVITKPEVKRVDVKLGDYRGTQNVVIAFHPFAFTAPCDRQIPSMEAFGDEFKNLDTQVLAVSCDPISAKEAWGKWLGGISYPLVSDFWPHGQAARAYGVFNEEFGRPDRSFFVVDKQGVIRWIKLLMPGEVPDTVQVLESLQAIQTP